MVYLVVRIKGTVNIPHWAESTLQNLHLTKRFRATLIPENEQTLGMLRKIKEIISWTSVDEGFIEDFIKKKGRISKNNESANSDQKDEPTKNTELDKIVTSIANNDTYLSKIGNIKPWFALSPPKGGFKKKSKRSYSQNGILGYNKELVDIVKRMM